MQIGRAGSVCAYARSDTGGWSHFTLPDVTIWNHPGQHHEIKHKAPTDNGWFGLEAYRFDALLAFKATTAQSVLYTIHNWKIAGGRQVCANDMSHWVTADVATLAGKWAHVQKDGTSWVNGVVKHGVPIYYWPETLWTPLAQFWGAKHVAPATMERLSLMGLEPRVLDSIDA